MFQLSASVMQRGRCHAAARVRPDSGNTNRVLCVRKNSRTQKQDQPMALIEFAQDSTYNPLDVVEQLANHNDWSFERSDEDEVTLVVTGRWADYQISFTWMTDIEALHIACAFDLKAQPMRHIEVVELVAAINEQLWVGHFDFWRKDDLVMFRQALVLTGGVAATDAQCETLLATAVEACERYFQAFQFVVWAGKSARDALDATLFETSGKA
jgi:hypothetical protein